MIKFDKISGWTAGIGVVLFAITLLTVLVSNNKAQQQSVLNWAKDNGYQVVQIEQPMFNNGPFPQGENVYRVKTKDGRFGWLRIVGKSIDSKWDDGNK